MICAVASGKGGTGKTTITASLAAVWDTPLALADVDVEEPNLHLFLHPEFISNTPAFMEIPILDPTRCTLCGECASLCRFKALSVMGTQLLVFAEMCHGCGGCLAVCPEGALSPGGRMLGDVMEGHVRAPQGVQPFLMGRLRVGEAMSPPLMRRVKERVADLATCMDVLIDSPPGVSCPAMNAVMDADVVVLVTEPTPFGLHDFRLAVEAFTPLGKPMGAVINRAGLGNDGVRDFCTSHGLPVWAEIPYSRSVAEAYSRGEVAVLAVPELRHAFQELTRHIRTAVPGANHA